MSWTLISVVKISRQRTPTPNTMKIEYSHSMESLSQKHHNSLSLDRSSDLKARLAALYSENAVAKILRTAIDDLSNNVGSNSRHK